MMHEPADHHQQGMTGANLPKMAADPGEQMREITEQFDVCIKRLQGNAAPDSEHGRECLKLQSGLRQLAEHFVGILRAHDALEPICTNEQHDEWRKQYVGPDNHFVLLASFSTNIREITDILKRLGPEMVETSSLMQPFTRMREMLIGVSQEIRERLIRYGAIDANLRNLAISRDELKLLKLEPGNLRSFDVTTGIGVIEIGPVRTLQISIKDRRQPHFVADRVVLENAGSNADLKIGGLILYQPASVTDSESPLSTSNHDANINIWCSGLDFLCPAPCSLSTADTAVYGQEFRYLLPTLKLESGGDIATSVPLSDQYVRADLMRFLNACDFPEIDAETLRTFRSRFMSGIEAVVTLNGLRDRYFSNTDVNARQTILQQVPDCAEILLEKCSPAIDAILSCNDISNKTIRSLHHKYICLIRARNLLMHAIG